MINCKTCGQPLPVDVSTFGGRLLKSINDSGKTREDVAEVAGFTSTHQISRWINGSGRPKDIEVLERVAQVLDVSPGWLLWGVQEPKLPIFNEEATRSTQFESLPDDVPQVRSTNPIQQKARDAGIEV